MERIFYLLSSLGVVLIVLSCASVDSTASGSSGPKTVRKVNLSESDKQAIGQKMWENECGGTVSGLTSWNKGEDFPSLGIGHFIWYIEGRPGPFDESFPKLISYFQKNGVRVPNWLIEARGCPWKTRDKFMSARNSAQMKELRSFLANTVNEQTGFIVQRLEDSLPKMMEVTPNPNDKARLESNFYAVARSRAGVYALIDYVNFKGEGIKASETYGGEGWGLRQVLLDMRPYTGAANEEFSEAAKRVLQRRVRNAPSSRGETRWLKGWMNRCESYKKGI